MTPSEHQRRGRTVLRISALAFGFCAAAYGIAGVWLSGRAPEDRLKQKLCAAWLCPLEFGPDRMYELHQTEPLQRTDAVAELERALETNPGSAYAWANLAEVLASGQDRPLTDYCLRHAVAAAPNSPSLLMRAANLALSEREYTSVITYLNRILRDPDVTPFYPAVFLTYSRMPVPLHDVLERGVPSSAAAASALMAYAIGSRRSSDAPVAWNWIVQHRLASDELTRDYLGFLLSHRQETAAAQTWAELNANRDAGYRRCNWVFNGAFEMPPRPVPFDWHIEPAGDVEVSRSRAARDGNWSMQLTFAGTENVQFEGLRQQTVLPAGKWRVSAAIRTDGITTDEGVAIRVFDALQSMRLDVTTDALTGTHDWTRVERLFEVKPETTIVGVEVFRRSSQRFDSKIAGTAWVDSVALTPLR